MPPFFDLKSEIETKQYYIINVGISSKLTSLPNSNIIPPC